MRKLIYGALALSAAMAVGFGAGANEAKADDPLATNLTDSALTFSTEGDDTLTVKVSGGNATTKVLVGVPAFKANPVINSKKETGLKSVSVKTWDVYNGEAVSGDATVKIDLSKYSKTKDNYLMIKTDFMDDKDAVAVIIEHSESIKAQYDKKTGKATVEKSDKTVLNGAADTVLRYYTTSGSEGYVKVAANKKEVTDASFYTDATAGTPDATALKRYQMSGATIYLETKKIKQSTDSADASSTTVNKVTTGWKITDKSGTKEMVVLDSGEAAGYKQIPTYTFAARSSAGAKLSISKLANAPVVTADYLKGTVTIPKGAEADVIAVDGSRVGSAIPATKTSSKAYTFGITNNTAGLKDGDLFDTATAKFTVNAVYPAGTGRIASKESHYVFPAQADSIAAVTNNVEKHFRVELSHKKGYYSGKILTTVKGEKYIVSYYDKKQDKRVSVTTSAAKDDAYNASATSAASKFVAANVGKATISNIDIDFANADKDKKVYIQLVGDKNNAVWVSKQVQFDSSVNAIDTAGVWDIDKDGDENESFEIGVKAKADLYNETGTSSNDINDDKVKAAVKYLEEKWNSATPTAKKGEEKVILASGDWDARLNDVKIEIDNGEIVKCSSTDGIKIKLSSATKANLIISKKPVTFAVDYATTEAAKDADCIAAYNALTTLLIGSGSNKKSYYVKDTIPYKTIESLLDEEKITWKIVDSSLCRATTDSSTNPIFEILQYGTIQIKVGLKNTTIN